LVGQQLQEIVADHMVERDSEAGVEMAAEAVSEADVVEEVEERIRPASRIGAIGTASGRTWLLLTASLALLVLAVLSWSVVFIFGIATAIAMLMLPLVSWLGRHGVGRAVAAGLTVLAMVLIIAALFIVIFAILVNQGIPFIQNLPNLVNSLYVQITALGLPPVIQSAVDALFQAIDQWMASVDGGDLALGFLQGILGFVAGVLSLMIVPFYIFYLVKDQPAIAAEVRAQIPVDTRGHIYAVIQIFKTDFVNYFKGELLVGGIMFVIITIGMLVLGTVIPEAAPLRDFAFILGLIAFSMEFLPTIGPIISMIPALLIALTISPVAFVIVLVFYLVAFQIESAILVPTIEGKVISFRPATILLLIAVGFAVGGILGAIVVLPVAAIARDLFSYFFEATAKAERELSAAKEAAEVAAATS
jgi:predicted PurR-regulated permease PerM